MLSFLIRSAARRRLLVLLWGESASGTVSSLARRASISSAAAHKELVAMRGLGIAREVRSAGARRYEAAANSPHADTLSALARLPEAAPTAKRAAPATRTDADRNRIRNALAAHGAPLRGNRVATRTPLSLEQTLAAGCQLAHTDPEVALAMPALMHTHRKALHMPSFTAALHELGEKHTAGFLLALTAKLTRTPALARLAEPLRDGRRTRHIHFFSPLHAPRVADDSFTLPIARAWHFHFPLPLADFRL